MKEILFTACSCSITCRRNKSQHQAPSKFWRSGYWKQLSDLIMIVSYTSLFINYLNSLQRDVHPDSLLVFALGTSSYSHALQKYSDCKTTEVLHILTLTEGGFFFNTHSILNLKRASTLSAILDQYLQFHHGVLAHFVPSGFRHIINANQFGLVSYTITLKPGQQVLICPLWS